MEIAHIALNLRLRHECRDRVHNDDIHGAASHHGLGNLERLLTGVRLGDVEIVDIDPDILCIDRIQRVLGVDKARNAAALLHFRDHMQRDRGLTGGLGAVDLDNASLRNAAESQREIQAQRSGRRGLHIHHIARVAEFHDRALAEILFNLL